MTPEMIYMLKVNVGIALFYAFYKLFCCRDTFFRWRRIALIAFPILSFLYPLLNIQTWIEEEPAMVELVDYYAALTVAPIPASAVAAPSPSMPDSMTLLTYLYYSGILLLSARLIIQLFSIIALSLRSKDTEMDGVRIKQLATPSNPFSFFGWIFIYPEGLQADEKREVLTHEQTHAQQWHSIDVIIGELVCIVCWMNPFIWLLKAEIRLNLEYLADHHVTESCPDTRRYQYHLLGLAQQKRQTGLYNNFNVSHLKNRITMMNKKRTYHTGRIKYALFAPLTAALLLISNIETVARTAEHFIASAEENVSAHAMVTSSEIVDDIVNFRVTVTNSEGKPQPNVTLQTKLSNNLITFQTDAKGKAEFELDVPRTLPVTMQAFIDNPKEGVMFVLSPKAPKQTVILDTPADMTAYAQAGKNVLVKMRVTSSDNQGISGATLTASESKQQVTTDAEGMAELRAGVLETILVSKDGYTSKNYAVKGTRPLKDMTKPILFALLKNGEEPVMEIVQEMPHFPEGQQALTQYLAKNINYPTKAIEANTQGRVAVGMIIEADGSISQPYILQSVSPELDAEAIRIIKNMPKWIPGKEHGKAVRCKYVIPISFSLGKR